MAIREYFVGEEKRYSVYVQARGKEIKRVRFQKTIKGIKSLAAANREEKRLIIELSTKVAKIEGKGLTWSEVLVRWEAAGAHGHLGARLNRASIRDHASRIRRHTSIWMDLIAADLTKGDGRKILNIAKSKNASTSLIKKIKNSINTIYQWGIEERLIRSGDRVVNHSPVFGLGIENKEEKTQLILSLSEIRKLLVEAKTQDHPWYHHWSFAILSGMRSGELFALKWNDVDFDNHVIRVSKSYNRIIKEFKSTKSGKWRNINISPQLSIILSELKEVPNDTNFVLPRVIGWRDGHSSKVLRMFLCKIGIDKYVTFHTLRACFATHLLSTGAEPMKVMRMGGWSDLKTFQIYLRMAGVDVRGVSDSLEVLPT